MPNGKKQPLEKRNEFSEYGPSWHDAAIYMQDLERKAACALVFELKPTNSVDGNRGIRFSVRERDSDLLLGACGFGRAYADGAKTMPAAIVHACIKAERDLIEAAAIRLEEAQEELPF